MPRPLLACLAALLLATGCPDSGLTVHNAAPEANVTSHQDGDPVYEGMEVTFRGTVSDPDGPQGLTATWWAGDALLCAAAAPADDGTTACTAVLAADQDTIILEAIDRKGASGSDQVVVAVIPGGAPVVTITSPEEGVAYRSNERITFAGRITDNEDAAADLAITWTSDVDGPLEVDVAPDAEGRVEGTALLTAGEHEVRLSATDSTDKTGFDVVTVTVLPPNEAPACAITAPADGAVGEEGEPVTFEGSATDAESAGADLDVTWTSDQDGTLATSIPGSGGVVSFTTADLSRATHVVTLRVEDPDGGACTAEVVYTVGSPPTLALEDPDDGSVWNEGVAIPFAAQVADADHAPAALTMTWTSDRDGVFSTEGPDGTGHVAFSTDALSRGTHVVTAKVTDPEGFWARATVTVTVNGLPSAPTVALGPDPARTADDLAVTLTSAAVDPDGDAVTYTYAWYENGVLRSTLTTDTVPSSATSRGDTWRVVVTPRDPYGSGTSGEDSLVIQDTAPTAPGVTVTPAEPVEDEDALLCSITTASTDADGDTVSYTLAWTVDGVRFTGTTTTTRTGDTVSATATAGEEEWTCTVTPSDGTLSGTAGSDTVFVLGTPVDYAHVQYPCSGSIARTTGTLDVYAWVFQPGVTDDYGEGPGITAEVGVGNDGTDPETHSSWTWTAAAYHDDKPAYGDASGDPLPYNNDEYLGTLAAPSTTGSFDFAFRFSTDAGLSWTYVDLGGTHCGGDGTIDGYDPADAGALTVYP